MGARRHRLRRIGLWSGLGLVTAAAALALAVWLFFIPSAQEPGYDFVAAWGGAGEAPGQFHDPTGLAIAGDELFVSDARNARIQVFDLDGNFLRAFDGDGALGRPMNLSVADGRLYVADYWNDRIAVFALDGRLLRTIGGKGDGPGQFNAPGGVAVGPAGQLYVADFYNQRVQELDAEGGFVRQWGETGKPGLRAGAFNYPTDVALDAQGRLFVADGYNDRVQVFAASGEFSHKWGGPFATNVTGPFNGWFATVTSIAIGPEGNVFAADFYNHRVQKFAPDGSFLAAFGAEGEGPGRFHYAIAVALAADGTVFVADMGNNRIEKWRPKAP